MSDKQIKELFKSNNLPEPNDIQKVAVGFTNVIYSIDEQYILKICNDVLNEERFENEAAFYTLFKDMLPVPKVIIYDKSRKLIQSPYMIYEKIVGDNLYNVWHIYSDEQRRSIVEQLSGLLRTINKTDLSKLPGDVSLTGIESWKDHILTKIEHHIKNLLAVGTISAKQAEQIRAYVGANSSALDEQKLALVYWDAHFDNVLVREGRIVGLIDFERTEIASIDFALDIVKRMVDHPKKYMSEHAEQFAKTEDYARLLEWFKEYSPELFAFKDIDTRLNLYAIEHDLKDLEGWPEVKELLDGVMQFVG